MKVVASSRRSWLPWLMLLVWSAWLAVAQTALAAAGLPAPDLGLVLLVACAGRFDPRELPRVALCVALGRAAFAVEPAVALVAGYLAAGLVLRTLRMGIELHGLLPRAIVSAPLAGGLAFWLELVHRVRDGEPAAALGARAVQAVLPLALTTSLATVLLATPLLYLPGLTPLRRRGSRPLGRRARRSLGRARGRAAW